MARLVLGQCMFWATTPVWPYGSKKKYIMNWPVMQSYILRFCSFFYQICFTYLLWTLETNLPPKTNIFVARLNPTTKRLKHLNTVIYGQVWEKADVETLGSLPNREMMEIVYPCARLSNFDHSIRCCTAQLAAGCRVHQAVQCATQMLHSTSLFTPGPPVWDYLLLILDVYHWLLGYHLKIMLN